MRCDTVCPTASVKLHYPPCSHVSSTFSKAVCNGSEVVFLAFLQILNGNIIKLDKEERLEDSRICS